MRPRKNRLVVPIVALIKQLPTTPIAINPITRPVRLKKSLERVMRRNRKAPQSAAVLAPTAIKAAATTERLDGGLPVYLT
jgi:hypothetical protein